MKRKTKTTIPSVAGCIAIGARIEAAKEATKLLGMIGALREIEAPESAIEDIDDIEVQCESLIKGLFESAASTMMLKNC